MRITKKLLSMILAVTLVLGLLPATAFATEQAEDVIYLSVSFDSTYIDDKNGNPIAYVPVPMSKIEAVDLTEYGLDNMLFDADGDGNYETTALQLLIYAHEELYGGNWSEVNFDALPGSSYFAGGIFGFTENLVYFHNGDFPVDETQQSDSMTVGATSDRIVLEAGDFLNVASFSCYAFLWDQEGGFHLFADPEGNYVHDYTAEKGQPLSVKLKRSFCDLMYGQAWIKDAVDFEVYYGKTFGEAEGSVITDENGNAEITFPDSGTYFVWCDGGNGSDDGTHGSCDYYYEAWEPCIVSAPAYAKVTVTGGTHSHSYDAVVTVPTCTEEGYTTYICACGDSYVADEVIVLGHDYQSEHFDSNPGYTLYTCSRCGDNYTVEDEVPVFKITTQPTNQNNKLGDTAVFTVEATDAVSYQWQRMKTGATTWTNISGATNASFSVMVSKYSVLPYRCVLKDADGNKLITDEVTIVLPEPLVNITNTAGNQHVIKNSSISFTVELDSTKGVTYQWQRCKNGSTWTNVSYQGNQTKTVTFDAASWAQFPFRCEITDANGTKIYTDSYTYTLEEPPIAPAITANPKDVYVVTGGTANFSVTAVGSGLTYQWWRSKDGGATYGEYTGADGQTTSISLNVYSSQEYLYFCEVKDGYGNTLKTKIVQPHLIAAVKVTSQPTVEVTDGTATFTFIATGDVRTYQWERLKTNGWVDANSASYIGNNTTEMSTAVAGTFRCRITDLAGNVTYTNEVTFAS